jgi:hypothetical protein
MPQTPDVKHARKISRRQHAEDRSRSQGIQGAASGAVSRWDAALIAMAAQGVPVSNKQAVEKAIALRMSLSNDLYGLDHPELVRDWKYYFNLAQHRTKAGVSRSEMSDPLTSEDNQGFIKYIQNIKVEPSQRPLNSPASEKPARAESSRSGSFGLYSRQ